MRLNVLVLACRVKPVAKKSASEVAGGLLRLECHCDTSDAPWTVTKSDCKKRARPGV